MCFTNSSIWRRKSSLDLLEKFQAEIGRRILRLSKYHSRLSVLIGLGWPSMKARVLIIKLGFLCRLLSLLPSHVSIATETFKTMASVDIYQISLIQQCLYLDTDLHTKTVPLILNDPDNAKSILKDLKKSVLKADKNLILKDASSHPSVSLASSINWLRIWEDARDNGQFWTKITQQFYKLITTPLFEDRQCPKCKELIPISTSFIEHFQSIHQCPQSIQQVLCELKDSHNCSMNTFHSMRTATV